MVRSKQQARTVGWTGKDAPDEGPRGQHHLEGVGQRHIGTQVAQSGGGGGAKGLGQLRRMGDKRGSAEEGERGGVEAQPGATRSNPAEA